MSEVASSPLVEGPGTPAGEPELIPPRLSPIRCVRCDKPFPVEWFNRGEWSRCLRCGLATMVEALPALLTPGAPGQAPKPLGADDQAGCYNHPDKKAVVPCDGCGRFLCSLCEIELGSKHLCPPCYQLEVGKGGGAAGNHFVMHDSVALLCAVAPLVITPLIALYLVIRHWNTPQSVLPRGRVRFVLAGVLALVQMGLWCSHWWG